jgi:hypothetical protein
MWLAIPAVLEASISNPVSGVDPGWRNNRSRIVFYNGDRIFLLYYKGGGDSNIYYKSSTDNVTWTGETLLFGGGSNRFNVFLVDDGKFDIVYVSGAYTYVRTCTILDDTITAGTSSTFFRIWSANEIGDAQNTTNYDWTQEINDTGADPTYPYEGVDKVLVVYQHDGGGSGNDGVRSIVVAHPNDEGEAVLKNYGHLPDFSNPIRISNTDFRIIVRPKCRY